MEKSMYPLITTAELYYAVIYCRQGHIQNFFYWRGNQLRDQYGQLGTRNHGDLFFFSSFFIKLL